jgi:transcriptional regulator with XRE-family HTH domain
MAQDFESQATQGARIRYFREQIKNLSRLEFAQGIDISEKALGNIETGARPLTERNLNAICRVYKINPEWIKDGKGEMLKSEENETFLDKLADEMKLSFRQKALLQSIIDLPPNTREAVINWALDLADKIAEEEIKIENESELKRRELLKQRQEIDAQLLELKNAEKNKEKETIFGVVG